MSFIQIVRLLVRFFGFIAFAAISMGVMVWYFTKDTKQEYKSHTLLNTGLISGYNIESSKGNRVDYAFTNNEIENLINLATSLETNKELSARILATVLIRLSQDKNPLLPENHEALAISLTDINLEIKDYDDMETVASKIVALRDANKNNPFYNLTNSKDPFFGIEQIEGLVVMREGSSDMIRMEYTSIDPFISQLTLQLLTDLFINKQKDIKEGQSDSVIKFFEDATVKTQNRLKTAEDELLKFRVTNKIINYYEQTRFISGNKEELDKQYQEELKVKAGAESALARIEAEIDDKSILPQLQKEIADNQGKIADYTNSLTEINLLGDSTLSNENLMEKTALEIKIQNLKNEMSRSAQNVLLVNETPEGVSTQNLLTQWLSSLITREESNAKLEVMEKRQAEYELIYDRFAPLGSTLKRLEREIDVAEREYLENLHSFNQARLHKYNMLMSSNLKVIDKPFFPAKAEKSKAGFMVILAFVAGLVVSSGGVIGMEFMDSSLKSPKNAAEQTGLRLAGLLPKYPKKLNKSSIDFRTITTQAMNLFVQELKVGTNKIKDTKNVVLFSIHPQEGKSNLINKIDDFMAEYYGDKESEFNFIELSSILNHPYGHDEVREADLHVLVTKADRKWTEADQHALKVYKKFVGQKPILFLNGVRTDIMEDVIGEVPKKRSWLRRKVKALLS